MDVGIVFIFSQLARISHQHGERKDKQRESKGLLLQYIHLSSVCFLDVSRKRLKVSISINVFSVKLEISFFIPR